MTARKNGRAPGLADGSGPDERPFCAESSTTARAREQAKREMYIRRYPIGIGMMAVPERWREWCQTDWFSVEYLEYYLAIEERALARTYSRRRAEYAELLANEIERRKAQWSKNRTT